MLTGYTKTYRTTGPYRALSCRVIGRRAGPNMEEEIFHYKISDYGLHNVRPTCNGYTRPVKLSDLYFCIFLCPFLYLTLVLLNSNVLIGNLTCKMYAYQKEFEIGEECHFLFHRAV